ncbi:hypothetical protein FACS1894122_13200 [Alphaproteobacteria bacterium]|nr:hypothetical protein FACS1894122_13200 [Alphaproteobacteria bacterium]
MASKFNNRDAFRGDKDNNNKKNDDDDVESTPQFLVVCDDFFEHALDDVQDDEGYGCDNAAPCLWFNIGSTRFIKRDTGGVSMDSRIIGNDPTVHMKYGSWGPLIQEQLYSGKNIPAIGIRRLSSVNGTKVIVQAIDYENCMLKTYQQMDDTIEFSFSATSAQDVAIVFDDNGTKRGNLGTKFNYTTKLIDSII